MCSAPWYSKTRRRSRRRESSDEVAEEDRRAQDALDEPEQQRRAELVLDQARQADRDDEEQADGEQQRDDDRAGPHAARDLLLLLGQLGVGGDAERLEADRQRLDERDDAADDRQAQRAVALEHGGRAGTTVTSISPRAASSGSRPSPSHLLGQRLADRDRPGRDAAHHHALEHGLAADGRVALRPELAGLSPGASLSTTSTAVGRHGGHAVRQRLRLGHRG